MKEKGRWAACLLLALWMIFVFCTIPAVAAEAETAMAEGLCVQQTGHLEWIALAASSVWALFLQVLRLKK